MDDIREKGLSGDEVYDRVTWRRNQTSTHSKGGANMKWGYTFDSINRNIFVV